MKNYKKNNYKKLKYGAKNSFILKSNTEGFFITCNGYEREAVIESYNLLNESAKILDNKINKVEENDENIDSDLTKIDEKVEIKTEIKEENVKNEEKVENNDEDSDSEDILSSLKKESAENKESLFKQATINIKNCLFIVNLSKHDCNSLVRHVFDEVRAKKCSQSKYVSRILPVKDTCDSNLSQIKVMFKNSWAKFIKSRNPESPKKYHVDFKIRYFDKIKKGEIIVAVQECMTESQSDYEGVLDESLCGTVVIFFNVLCKTTCLSIIEDYAQYAKYNIQQLV